MKQFTYIIKDPIGIHARPATILAKEARNFESEIIIEGNGKKTNIEAMITVMSMAIKHKNQVVVTAEGSDEVSAISKIEDIFKTML